jgi:bidirectional [NiFe] hydrogenase diaphorase subunit
MTYISEADRRTIERILKHNRYNPHALIEILHAAQERAGYLDRGVLRYLAEHLRLPPSLVYGVAGFYHAFRLQPHGKHHCTVCTGTSCHIRGGSGLLARLENRLGVRSGETATDGSISLDSVRCLGVCGLAPLVMLDGTIMGGKAPDQMADAVCGQIAKAANRGRT